MYKGFCILTGKHSDSSLNMVESRRKKKKKRVEVTTKRPGISRESLQNEEFRPAGKTTRCRDPKTRSLTLRLLSVCLIPPSGDAALQRSSYRCQKTFGPASGKSRRNVSTSSGSRLPRVFWQIHIHQAGERTPHLMALPRPGIKSISPK
jgi:hypothetical protein